MNQSLLFALRADKNAEESLIFIQYLKFYLGVKSELWKAKYQINMKNITLGEFIKKFSAKIIQKGFLPKHPNYDKQLYIMDPHRTLELLHENSSTSTSLMIKKINYGLFSEVK